ncbi:MAG: UbiA family prenyltransferase [Candidatus Micrarchaeota archaeon]
MRSWYGSRIVDSLVSEVDFTFPFSRQEFHAPSLYQDFMSLTKINRTGTAITSLIGGIGYATQFSGDASLLMLQGAVSLVFAYVPISILNDILDADADRLNESERPIARGALSPIMAMGMASIVLFLGMLVTLGFGTMFAAFFLAEFALGLIYCFWAKRMGSFSYALLGFTHIGFPFIMGALLGGGFSENTLLVGAYVYLTMFLCISIKDFKDIEGDKKTGVRTFPLIFGKERAYRITATAFLFAPLTFFIPWIAMHLSAGFVAAYSVVSAWKLKNAKLMLKTPSAERSRKILDQFRFAVMGEMIAWGVATI